MRAWYPRWYYLQVRAASQSHLNLNQHFPICNTGNRHFFDLDVFLAVENGSGHFSIHDATPSHALPGWMTIFMESG